MWCFAHWHELLALPVWTSEFFVSPCNELAKYFYTDADLYNTWGKKIMVEFFFQFISKWAKWLSQTLHPFSHTFKFFSGIRGPIVAPPSDDFRTLERTFLPRKFLGRTCTPMSRSRWNLAANFTLFWYLVRHLSSSKTPDILFYEFLKWVKVKVKLARTEILLSKGFNGIVLLQLPWRCGLCSLSITWWGAIRNILLTWNERIVTYVNHCI